MLIWLVLKKRTKNLHNCSNLNYILVIKDTKALKSLKKVKNYTLKLH